MGGAASGAPFTRILPLSLETFLKHQCNGVWQISLFICMVGPNISARGLKNIRLYTLEIHSLTRFFAPRDAIF